MKRKNFATVSGVLAALSLTFSPAFADDAHHPEKSGGAAAGNPAATAPAKPAAADEANKQLTRAQALMQRIEQTRDPAEQKRLMQEHLQAMREGMGMKSDDELAGYVKSTFLGTAKPAERAVERTFMGKKVAGGVQNVKIPRKAELTLFLIPLSGEDTLALALVRDASVPPDEAESVLATISRTITEIPEKKSE